MEIIKCKYILFTKPVKKHQNLLFFLICGFCRVFVPYLFFGSRTVEGKDEKLKQKLYKSLTRKYIEIFENVISALFLGFAHFYYRLRNREEFNNIKQQSYNTNIQKGLIFNSENNSNRAFTTFKIILIISSVDIICQLLVPIKVIVEFKKYKDFKNLDETYLYSLLIFDIFARYFFSRWILKTYFYAHHKLSFLLTFIGLTIIMIADSFVKIDFKWFSNNHEKFDLLYILFLSIRFILYSFEDIMNKVAFRALSILPCTLIFYNGLIQLCFFIIISILFFTYINYDITLLEDVSSKSKEILYLFVYLPFNIMRNLYLIRVIDKFSAQHMAFLRVLESLSIFVFTEIKNGKDKRERKLYYILQLIGFLILCFASLMHNELIIINSTKLKAKTEYYLDKDADKEQNNSDYSDTLLSDSKENSCCSNINDDLTGSDIS